MHVLTTKNIYKNVTGIKCFQCMSVLYETPSEYSKHSFHNIISRK